MSYSQLITNYLGNGTHASRPASPNVASGVSPIYYETDTGSWMGWNGTLWTPINGGLNAVATKSASYTALGTDRGTCLIANAASLVFTLPAPATAGAGFSVVVKNNNQTTTSVKTNTSGVTIDGVDCSSTGATTGLTTAYGAVRYLCDGSNWFTVAMDGGGSGSSTLAGDSDVSISSPASGQVLGYNGTDWTNVTGIPAELGHATLGTTPLSTTSTTAVDLTGASLTVTIGSRAVMIELYCSDVNSPTNGIVSFVIYDVTASQQLARAVVSMSGSGDAIRVPMMARFRHAPAAGSRTYKMQWYVSTATGTINLGSNDQYGLFRVYEL